MAIVPFDYLFSIFLLAFIYLFLYRYAKRTYARYPQIRKYFLLGFTVKAIGAIGIGVVYQYYYGFGDTFGFYRMGLFFSEIIRNEPGELLNVLFRGNQEYFLSKAYQYNFVSWYAFNTSTVTVARFCAGLNFVTFGYYLPTAILFALISYSGIWKLYLTFIKSYPALFKELAIFVLFIPSVFFWGSGLMKDTLTIGALGWLTYGFYSFFISHSRKLVYVVICTLTLIVIFSIKAYVALAFIPAAAIWIIQHHRKQIRSNTTKVPLIPVFIGIMVLVALAMQYFLVQEFQDTTITAVVEAAAHTSSAISGSDAGSVYNLGAPGEGLGGTLSLVVPAIIVTFFRPFPWEIHNVLSVLAAIESLLFLFFTLYILFNVRLAKVVSTLFNRPLVLFCLLFAFTFAVPVGIASNNFGTLVRYKIPCIPFFAIGLFMIYYVNTGKSFLGKRSKQRRKSALSQFKNLSTHQLKKV